MFGTNNLNVASGFDSNVYENQKELINGYNNDRSAAGPLFVGFDCEWIKQIDKYLNEQKHQDAD